MHLDRSCVLGHKSFKKLTTSALCIMFYRDNVVILVSHHQEQQLFN